MVNETVNYRHSLRCKKCGRFIESDTKKVRLKKYQGLCHKCLLEKSCEMLIDDMLLMVYGVYLSDGGKPIKIFDDYIKVNLGVEVKEDGV